MKRILLGAAAVLSLGSVAASCKPHTFANCTEMHSQFMGGVARPGAIDKRPGGGHARYAPFYSADWYNLNTKSDRDADGIACEQ